VPDLLRRNQWQPVAILQIPRLAHPVVAEGGTGQGGKWTRSPAAGASMRHALAGLRAVQGCLQIKGMPVAARIEQAVPRPGGATTAEIRRNPVVFEISLLAGAGSPLLRS